MKIRLMITCIAERKQNAKSVAEISSERNRASVLFFNAN